MAITGGSVTATIESGGSPLGVVFSAKDLTFSTTTEPWRDCLFVWNFGDPGSGNWTKGAYLGSKNEDRGVNAAHVYEVAADSGTTVFTPTLTIYEPDGSGGLLAPLTPSVPTISVTDGNTHWSDANTYYFANTTAGLADAPTSATNQIVETSLTTIASTYMQGGNERYLFRRGDSFSGTASSVDGPNISIEAFGSGADPIWTDATGDLLTFGTTNRNNIRVVDIDFQVSTGWMARILNTATTDADILFLRCTSSTSAGIQTQHDTGATIDAYEWIQGLIIQEFTRTGTETDYGMLVEADFLAVMGCDVDGPDDPPKHALRIPQARYYVIAHNELSTAFNNALIKIHSIAFSSWKCEYGVTRDNLFEATGSDPVWIVNFTTQSSGTVYNEVLSRAIIERNFWDIAGTATNPFQLCRLEGDNLVARNNIARCTHTGGEVRFFNVIDYNPNTPDSTDCYIVGNTMYSAATSGTATLAFLDSSPTDTIVKNNLCYVPGSGTADVINDSGTNTTDSGNVETADSGTADLTTSPPVTTGDFVRTGDNADGAWDVSLFDDMSLKTRRTGTPDAGASETTDDGLPTGSSAVRRLFLVRT